MTNRFQFLLSLFLLVCLSSSAQNITNRGREFWVGYGHHQFMEPGQNNGQNMVLYFSAEQTAQVTVTVRGRTATQVTNYPVPANTAISSNIIPKSGPNDARLYDVPPSFGGNGGEGIFPMSIHIQSTVPIVAYAHIYGSVSSGASMLMPVDAWGYSYTSINSEQIDAGGPGFSWVYAIAQQDNTVIEVTPSVNTRLNKPANVPFRITLNRGEIYQIVGQSNSSGTGNQFTGTRIRSVANSNNQCHPIAVFSGSSRTRGESVPCGSGSGRDNDMQQCFPQTAWGKRYLTAPFSSSNGTTLRPTDFQTSVYKIVTREPGTQVRVNGNVINPNAAGCYQFSANTAQLIEADKPIMVAQFMSGSSTCNPGSSGDPEMVFLSPIEQAIKSVGFFRNNLESIRSNYVTAVIPAAGLASMTINGLGQSSFNHVYDHPRVPGYKIVVRGWPAAQQQVIMRSDSAFTAITYGLGDAESYAYNAGTLLNNLNAIGGVYNVRDTSVKAHEFTCVNTPAQISALMAYKPTRLEFRLSALAGIVTPSTDVVLNNPVVNDSLFVNGVKYYQYQLPGTYRFNQAGTFTIPIRSFSPTVDNCSAAEDLSISITVRPGPRPDFTIVQSACPTDSIELNGLPGIVPGFTISQYNWIMTSPAADTVRRQNIRYVFPTGTHPVRLEVVTREGCVGDTTKPVTINAGSMPGFSWQPTPVCAGTTVTFTPVSMGTNGSWYWDFGNGQTQTAAAPAATPTVTYTQPGSYLVKLKWNVNGSSACPSDTARQLVHVFARPALSFTYPQGCLNADGTVQFTSTTTVSDTQTIQGYSWNFGNPGSGAANKSTAANPVHTYPGPGTYTIQYGATTSNGCRRDTTISVTFNIRPTLQYPQLGTYCFRDTLINVAQATASSNVTGTGVYAGPGTTAAGMFNPALAGVGAHVIKYFFTSSGNCLDSIASTITVLARPRASFEVPAGGCLNSGTVTLNNTSTMPGGGTLGFSWNFGDPNATPANPNTSTATNPSHNFATGTYPIRLTATAQNGCAHDTTINVTFSIKPDAVFGNLDPVCENATGALTVAQGSVTNNVAGTGVYQGPGTSANGAFAPAVAGPGVHQILFIFTTPGGCADTATRSITVYARPRANFTFPDSCLPVTGLVQFNNTTTVSDGQTMTYQWNFANPNATAGNPNTSTATNPTHNYSNNGSYNVRLTATTANGCVGDTTISANFRVKPQLAWPALNPVCENGTVGSLATGTVLNGVTGTATYGGNVPGLDASGGFNPSVAGAGVYEVKYFFTSTGGCTDSLTRSITVNPRPRPSFTFPNGTCMVNGSVTFTNTSTIAGNGPLNYQWNFGGSNTSTAVNPTHVFADGNYPIRLTATSAQGCTADTTINASFSIQPALAFPALASVCENAQPVSVATASVTNSLTGNGTYSGPGTTAAGMFNPATVGPGTYTITYTFITAAGCTATRTSDIVVKTRPRPAFTYPAGGCLVDGTVQFTNTSPAISGSTLTYEWNFGNSNATPSNPNTSTAANPSHVFGTGTYPVRLTALASNGCSGDTTINATFSIKPQLSFAPLSPVCASVTGTVSVAQATVTNGVPGTGVYSGTATDAAGNFNPSVAGANTHVITYTFTSAAGCVETIQRTIVVHPKPVASFTVSDRICIDGRANITDNSTVSAGTIVSWQWNLGNGQTPTVSNNTPFSVAYSNAGPATVSLAVVSDQGCLSDRVQRTLTVHPLPVASFTVPASVCLPGGAANFTSTTTVGDGSALTYQWNFGDGSAAATGTTVSHIYSDSAEYAIRLVATSSFGCVDDTVRRFSAFFGRPFANFAISDYEICQGDTSRFTDLSVAPGSTVTRHLWNFGDNTTDTASNPVKVYREPNLYAVNLRVTNGAGCVGDTTINLKVHLQPRVDAGPSFVVAQGSTVRFNPTVNSSTLEFTWTPPAGLSNPSALRPTLVALQNQRYYLTAEGDGGCTATDSLDVKILLTVKIPNAFSPNADGINDTWAIENLKDYPGATVEVFNRYGQRVYFSNGYATPWDGRFNGSALPFATYYYVITLKNGFAPITGTITIVR